MKKTLLILSVMFMVVGCDQTTKMMAVKNLKENDPIVLMKGMVRLEYAENPGAFMSLGAQLPRNLRMGIFVFAVAGLLTAVTIFLFRRRGSILETIFYSLIIAGGIGNLIDRVFRPQGHVVDFLNFGIGTLRTGIFNVADMAIVAGVLGLIGVYYLYQKPVISIR